MGHWKFVFSVNVKKRTRHPCVSQTKYLSKSWQLTVDSLAHWQLHLWQFCHPMRFYVLLKSGAKIHCSEHLKFMWCIYFYSFLPDCWRWEQYPDCYLCCDGPQTLLWWYFYRKHDSKSSNIMKWIHLLRYHFKFSSDFDQ